MVIFIDESGIHKQKDYSVIALVYVEIRNVATLEKCVEKIEKKLGIEHFHWSDFGSRRGWGVRKKFFTALHKLNFTCKIALIANPTRISSALEYSLRHLVVEQRIAKIIIDGKKPQWYSHRLKKVLRDKGISVKKIQTARDESRAGLRLADAIAGLARSYHDNPSSIAKSLYRLIENKITAQFMSGQRTR